MKNISRRDFLSFGAVGLFTTPYILRNRSARRTPTFNSAVAPEDVFALSVASGDPTPTGVMLWTRVNPSAWSANSQIVFQVATDNQFSQIIAEGSANSADFGQPRDFTVKIDLDGQLPQTPNGSFYFYRFIYNNTASRTGRCRTLPAPNTALNQIKFAYVTCQDYTNGYYGAFYHLAQEPVDFVLHMGDFIYEAAGDPRYQSLPFDDRRVVLPSGGTVALGLEDFRFIYRTYRADRFMQMALENHTFIHIWDDHECCNDAYWDYERDCLGAPDHPFTNDPQYGNLPQRLNRLKLDSQRAWNEYVPARIVINRDAVHPHEFMSIYRQFTFGDLIDLILTDQRTYRSAHPCGEGSDTGGYGLRYATPGCPPQQMDAARTMLGVPQRNWFLSKMLTSNKLWKVWGNEVFTAPLKASQTAVSLYVNVDAWDGYEFERDLLMQQLKTGGVRNLVTLTGDLHTYMASYQKLNYAIDPLNLNQNNLVGVEYMTPGVTSANLQEIFAAAPPPAAGLVFNDTTIRATNPHVQFFNSSTWGYATLDFSRERVVYTAYSIDKSVNSTAASKTLLRQMQTPVRNQASDPILIQSIV